MRLRYRLISAMLCGALSAAAGLPARAGDEGSSRRLAARYEVFVGGINALGLRLDAVLAPRRYALDVNLATKGVAEMLVDWRMSAESRGVLSDGHVRPHLAAGDSVWRGKSRRQRLEFGADGSVSATVEPPVDPAEREPVPEAMRGGSRDLAAALFSALLAIGRDGRCDHAEKVFDARRLYELRLEDAGRETLRPNDYSPYAGPALVCRLTVRILAGRRLEDGRPDDGGAARFARVWLARVFDGAPMLPVRLHYEMRFGDMTAYLSAATLNDGGGKPEESLASRR